MNTIKLVATDLDGTFLKNDRSISSRNLDALRLLGEKNIVRVAATGRNLHKVKEVLYHDVPFDFVVFSSGAGVFDWKHKKHLFRKNINPLTSSELIHFFIKKRLNFHAFFPVPENHKHWYFRGDKKCEEFERYFDFNNAFASEIKPGCFPDSELCQFLIIIREDRNEFENLKAEIEAISPEIRVIRTSSPITKGYIWIEVFHKLVSKGNGVQHICDLLDIEYGQTLGIGNDYNDFDLLDFAAYSFMTENAPPEISELYKSAPSNENDAFAFVAEKIL